MSHSDLLSDLATKKPIRPLLDELQWMHEWFDSWREAYDSMSFEDHVAIYDEMYRVFPEQEHHDTSAVVDLVRGTGVRTVVELGGWTGTLAAQVLSEDTLTVTRWTNFDICGKAIRNPDTSDHRYVPIALTDWAWKGSLPTGDLFVATHMIEHLSNSHFFGLLKAIRVAEYPIVHLESPLTDDGQDWNGYFGSHKLLFGWEEVCNLMNIQDYKLVGERDSCFTFARNKSGG